MTSIHPLSLSSLSLHAYKNLAAKRLESREYRKQVLNLLHKSVPFDACCFTTVDPASLLSTGAVVEDSVESIHPQLFENEYLQEDFNKYAQLARTGPHAASLSSATGGRLRQSARFRNILSPAGLGDELRAALMSSGACWGFLTLFRREDKPLFQADECAYMAALIPDIAQPLRQQYLQVGAEASFSSADPGLLLLTPELEPISSNASADYWLSRLREWEQIEDDTWPRPIRAVCSQARSLRLADAEADGADEPASSAAKVCLQTPSRDFLTLQATQMSGGPSSPAHLAILLERSRPAELVPLIVQSYGLSPREKEIVQLVLQGYSTKELAQALYISAYTVQDHLKSIFEKTGVNSRRELTWSLLAQLRLPAL